MATKFKEGQDVRLMDSPALRRLAEQELWMRFALRSGYVFKVLEIVVNYAGKECAVVRSPLGPKHQLQFEFFCEA